MIKEVRFDYIAQDGQNYFNHGYTESCARKYFESQGYKITKSKLIFNHILLGTGRPDFFASKQNKSFWIEVKRKDEKLLSSQKKWLDEHSSERVIIFRINFVVPKLTWERMQQCEGF